MIIAIQDRMRGPSTTEECSRDMQYQNPDPRFDSLVDQLNIDGIAFETANEGTGSLEQSLSSTLSSAHDHSGLNVGLVFLDSTPELRDLAQDLNLATGIETIYIRTPDVAIATSEKFPRSSIEAGQLASVRASSYEDGVAQFLQEASSRQLDWISVLIAVAVVLIVTCGATAIQNWRQA